MYVLTKRSFARRYCPLFSWKSFVFSFYLGMSLNSLIFSPRKTLKLSLKVLECPGILNKNFSGHHETYYDAKISHIESKYFTTSDYNKFSNEIIDIRIKEKQSVKKCDIS